MIGAPVTKEQREHAKRVANMVARKLPNGPTAGLFRNASEGMDEDVLFAIHLILNSNENAVA